MYILIIVILIVIATLSGLVSLRMESLKRDLSMTRTEIASVKNSIDASRQETTGKIDSEFARYGQMVADFQRNSAAQQDKRLCALDERFHRMTVENGQKLEDIRTSTERKIADLTKDNNEQLEKMRQTVDEKLQKTLEERIGQSFRTVSERLEQVSKGLGEMQTLADGVGDLKKVLSNVKTRGILGEIQLGAILEEILAPGQYDKDVNVTGKGRNNVEYAVRMPGEAGETIYLPIDSKFPGDTYHNLLDAYETGRSEAIAAAKKNLSATILSEAKDISDKYISPPATTNFGIMFLPFEGLYAEVVRLGLLETLQHDYKVNIAGPTTLAALLNSLQMGFRTLAIQKRSNEVWNVLASVKTEFGKFNKVLTKAQENLRLADKNLDELVGTRSRQMERRLRDVTKLPEADSNGFVQQITAESSGSGEDGDRE